MCSLPGANIHSMWCIRIDTLAVASGFRETPLCLEEEEERP